MSVKPKFLAYRNESGDEKPITIIDVIKGRRLQNPLGWEEGVIYYSLWRRRPMKAVVHGKRPHFAYSGKGQGGHDEGGESVEHELSKHIISNLKEFKVKVYYDKESFVTYDIPIVNSRLEYPAEFEGRKYRIDVMLEAAPCPFTKLYGSNLIGVEVCKSNEVRTLKKADLRNMDENIILLETKLFSEIKLENMDIDFLNRRLEAYWKGIKSPRTVNCLVAPNKEAVEQKYLAFKKQREQKPIPVVRETIVGQKVLTPTFSSVQENNQQVNEILVTQSQKPVLKDSGITGAIIRIKSIIGAITRMVRF